MGDPLRQMSSRVTPQSQPIPGKAMVKNSAGGYTFQVDDWSQLQRFLILGTTGGTYYIGERDLTKQNVDVVRKLAAADGARFVSTVVDVSVGGRARKVEPAIFALAVAAAAEDPATRARALAAVPQVCRTGTHLFTFAEYVQNQRGWGRGLRKAVAAWYERDVDDVAFQAVKYRQRNGWTHRDLLRLSHPEAGLSVRHSALYDWISGRGDEVAPFALPEIVQGYQRVQRAENAEAAAKLIRDYKLPHEAIPTDFLRSPAVWEALFPHMGITALIRNLGRMSNIGLVVPFADINKQIVSQLTDGDKLRKGRVHPMQVLDALLTYTNGRGARGDLTWVPVPQITDALDQAFYLSFGAVEPAGKRTMLAVDVSGSMDTNVSGSHVMSCRAAAAAMALVTANSEPEYMVTAFQHWLTPLDITPRVRLDTVIRRMNDWDGGGTDCALPMTWALQQNLSIDTFVVLTDNETWAGTIQPSQALRQYRERTGIPARLAVVSMEANKFTIADPDDAGMMDFVGFDTATPNSISSFSRGDI